MTLATLYSSFLSPALFSAAIIALLGTVIVHRGVRPSNPLPDGALTMIALWFPFAALAVLGPTFNYGHTAQNPQAVKFFIAGFALVLGVLIGNERSGGLRHAFPLFLVGLVLYYGALFLSEAGLDQDAMLYPPDNNNSAAVLAVFLPVVVLRWKGWERIALLCLMALFAFLVSSRALLALSVLALAISTGGIRNNKVILFGAVPLCGAILFYKGFSLDNFSDRLRLQILEVSYSYATGRGLHPFNFGEAAFKDFLNIYPIYRRLEIEHAHNIVLQIWVAYGWAPLIAFLIWLANLVRIAWQDRNELLLYPLGVFFAFGMIEAIISDTRAFGEIMFLLGYAYARGHWEARDRRQAEAAGSGSSSASLVELQITR